MPLPLTRIQNWVPGEEVDASDLQDLASWARMKDSMVAFAVSGVTAFLPAFNIGGIACVPGSGLQVLLQAVGSATSCRIFLPQRSDDGTWTSVNAMAGNLAQAAYYTPPGGGFPQTLATPPGAGSPYRTDLICVQFNASQVNPHSVNVRSGTLVTPQTVYAIDDTLTFAYVPGTPSNSFPAPTPTVPDEFVALYTVYVQHGDTSVSPSAINLVMPTYDGLIAAMSNLVLVTQPFACPAVGAPFTVITNGAPTINSGYYYILGPHDGHGVVAVQTAGAGTNVLTMTCIAVLFGTIGTNILAGAAVNNITQPILYVGDSGPLYHTVVNWFGFVPDPGSGGTATVTFPQAFANVADYRVTGLTPIGAAFNPYVGVKNLGSFTIVLPTGNHGNVDWEITGHFNP